MKKKGSGRQKVAASFVENLEAQLADFYTHTLRLVNETNSSCGVCFFRENVSSQQVTIITEALEKNVGFQVKDQRKTSKSYFSAATSKKTISCQVTVEEKAQLFGFSQK